MTEPSAEQGESIGEILGRAREAQGLALADVARSLKFSVRQLEALEQDRYDLLPGGTITRGLVRSYARLLRLDPEPLVERLSAHFEAPDAARLAARYRQSVPFSDSSRRSNLIYLALSVAILAVVAAVAFQWHQDRSRRLAFVAPAAAPVKKEKQQKPERKPQKKPQEKPEPKAAAPVPAPPAPPPPAPAVEKPAAVAPSAQPVAAVPEAASHPAAAAGGPDRILLECEEECWTEVRDASGQALVYELSPAGTHRVIAGRAPFSLVIGNASHAKVTFDDRPVELHPRRDSDVARLTVK